jgi:hypothetical protein
MKNLIATILLLLFVLPSFAPMMPHDVLQLVHEAQEMHHSADTHGHHHTDDDNSSNHSVRFDIVTYFDEYLHLDLKQAMQADLVGQSMIAKGDFTPEPFYLAVASIPSDYTEAIGIPPPEVSEQLVQSDKAPVYLSTLRLRI